MHITISDAAKEEAPTFVRDHQNEIRAIIVEALEQYGLLYSRENINSVEVDFGTFTNL